MTETRDEPGKSSHHGVAATSAMEYFVSLVMPTSALCFMMRTSPCKRDEKSASITTELLNLTQLFSVSHSIMR